MGYLSNNLRRNCLDKWSNHKLSISHMSRKGINVMILIIIKVIFEIYLEPGGFLL